METETYKPMDAFDSMTESIFIIKPPKSTKKTKKPSLAVNDGFVPLLQGKEAAESMRLRKQLFTSTWEPVEQLLVEIEHEINNTGVKEICNFVNHSYTRVESDEKGRLERPFTEIATAVAFAGVNTGDHSKLFSLLQDMLIDEGHHVALLESQYSLTLSSMIKFMLEQVATTLCNDNESRSRAGGLQDQSVLTSSKAISYDMSLLEVWWKQQKRQNQKERIVVIIQDFEGFAQMVIDDFIRIATSYCSTVPIVVVLGLATSYESVHQSLTMASISMLNVERFNLQRSKECIDGAIGKLFVQNRSILSFGAEAYRSLLDQFLLHNFSISGFVNKIKFAVMDFFYANPLSVLASMLGEDQENNGSGVHSLQVVDCPIKLNADVAELIRMQRSVQNFLEKQLETTKDREYLKRALTNDDFLQNTVLPEMMRQLVSYRRGYSLGIDMILAIQSIAPESMRKPLRTLHYYGIGQDYDDCEFWKTLSAVVRKLKEADMADLISKLQDVVENAIGNDGEWEPTTKNGSSVAFLLYQTAQMLANPEEVTGEQGKESAVGSSRIRTRNDMENKPFLLFDSNSSDYVLQALEQCCQTIEAVLRACLEAYTSAPLHEVFYYRHSLLLDTTFSAQPRAAVQAALGKSQYYIACECCNGKQDNNDEEDDDSQRIMASMQDTSIAYRLHQECGRMINLYDWHSAFSSVVEGEEKLLSRKQKLQPDEIQARFMRSIEELRYLGFIKATQRKTDHVIRQTWGM